METTWDSGTQLLNANIRERTAAFYTRISLVGVTHRTSTVQTGTHLLGDKSSFISVALCYEHCVMRQSAKSWFCPSRHTEQRHYATYSLEAELSPRPEGNNTVS